MTDAIIAGLALHSFLVAVFMSLFVASSRRDRALADHFAEPRPRRRRGGDKARWAG